ncbi:LysR family transcriptional regulator [bacterium]|nr:LysR family transcriptional regulator [bacterium]
MEFHDLEVFVVVTQEKSFSRAAKKIFRTQPAVSLAIRRLEEEMGGAVFDRASKEPILTDIGRILYEYARELLNLRNQVIPAVEELKSLKRGIIRIGSNETGAIFLLPHIIEYRKQFPDIKVEVLRFKSRMIPDEIMKRNIDLGIIGYDPKDPHLSAPIVYEDHLSLVVYPSHKFAKKKKVNIKDLAGETFAAHFVRASFRDQIISLFEKKGVPLNIDVELPTVEAIKQFVEMKQAVAMVPSMCIESEVRSKRLVDVEVSEIKAIQKKLRAVHIKGKTHTSFAARAFISILQKNKDIKF